MSRIRQTNEQKKGRQIPAKSQKGFYGGATRRSTKGNKRGK